MKTKLLKMRLAGFLLRHHLFQWRSGHLTPGQAIESLRRQLRMSSLFRDAKYSQVGGKVFIDPFAPYFPSPYCKKLFDNNTANECPPRPNFAQISITSKCPCECVHCHVKNTQGSDLPKEVILKAIGQIAAADFPLIFFVGGEPLSRFDELLEFVSAARDSMDTRIFTSGVGATTERLRRLREAGLEGICVSLDHFDAQIHNGKRKHPAAFNSACNTIRDAVQLGYYVSAVCCTTAPMVRSGELYGVVDLVESLGAHSVQLNEIRPVGRATETPGYDFFLSAEDKQALVDYYVKSNRSNRKVAIVMPWYNEEPARFGCTATASQQAYIDAEGNLTPCPLLKLGFGNIAQEDFSALWDKFRANCHHPVRECLVHHLSEPLNSAPELPLPPEASFALWKEVCALEPTDVFKTLHGTARKSQEPPE